MKKILFIIPYLSSGGAERVVSIWVSELAKLGCDIQLLVFYRIENEYALDDAVIVHSLKREKSEYDHMSKIMKLCSVRKALQAIKPDIAVPFISYVGLMLFIAKIGLPIKIVETIRNNPKFSPPKRIHRWLRNIAVFFSRACLVQNQAELKYFPAWMQKHMVVMANPIADEFVEKEKVFLEKKINSIAAAGRLEKQKNFPLLIRTFAKIAATHHTVQLKIYGEGSQFPQLKEMINHLNLSGQATLCGRANHMAEMLENADLFVLSSDSEGMPNALMEAMAIGLPCISTDCPTGPAELIEPGVNGLLVPVGDEAELVAAMDRMITDVEKAIDMGSMARISMLRRYRASQSVQELMRFFEEL